MQLLCNTEEGHTKGLNIFSCVRKFTNKQKVPQMGWNIIKNLKGPLYEKIENSMYISYTVIMCLLSNIQFQLPTMV